MKFTLTEKQKFDSIWFYAILAVVSVINYVTYVHLGEADLNMLLATYGMTILGGLIFFIFRLDTKYDQHGIEYRFFPFHIKWHKIKWGETDAAYIRTYSPLREYGGWGIRNSKNGKAYTTRGNTGLQLQLKNGSFILFGTQKKEELIQLIKKLNLSGTTYA